MKPLLLFALFLLFACKQKLVVEKVTDNYLYHKAFDFKDGNQLDSAFLYFSKAKEHFVNTKDNFSAGKCLVNMGMISTDNGDYFGGQEASLEAIKYFVPNKSKDEDFYILTNYNNLGLASSFLGSVQQSIAFYEKCLPYAKDVEATYIVKNNIANVYRKKLDYSTAISIYNSILKKDISKKSYARVLSNLAFTRWLAKSNSNVLPNLKTALQIRIQENDLWGQNASYAHLSDFYLKSKPDSGLFYAQKMYEVAKKLKSGSDQMQAIEKLISVGPVRELQEHFANYKRLDDSIQKAHGLAKNQFALIRYETEKHKADFIKSKTENAQKQRNIILQWLMILLLTFGILAIILYFKKRSTALKQKKDLEVKATELKYVKKIHDRVANKVYQVMAEVENIPELSKDDILDKLEIIYGISRDISYENVETESEEVFAVLLNTMLKSYASASTEVLITGNEESIWNEINGTVKTEIWCILQELMTNMDKHSQATKVDLNFHKANHAIQINYKDNGVGVKKALHHKNGLTNTGNRIDAIHGTITFDTETEKGLMINISFPIL